MVYEQSDSLAPVVEIQAEIAAVAAAAPGFRSRHWLRWGRSATKLLAALFSDDAVKNKRNTDTVEVAQSTLVAARVLEHKPASVRPFERSAPTSRRCSRRRRPPRLARKKGGTGWPN